MFFFLFLLSVSFARSRRRHIRRHHRSSRNSDSQRVLGMLPGYADDVEGSFLIPKREGDQFGRSEDLHEQDLEMQKIIEMFKTKDRMTEKLVTINRRLLAEQEAEVHELLMDLFNRLKTRAT